ncbi:protein of unknown function [Alkalicoccus daliensis]|uniref:DUF1883 domain-containing protein n=2 Tax=Alkalicoccus daliensis TaxID=745820 RepID=A0A1H0EST3_9BACI|nr:protein of unknown function [Alkalicoccus daliensis]
MAQKQLYRYLREGDTLEVDADDEVQVYLMDLTNFRKYQSSQSFFRYGGKITRSPSRIKVPKTGPWYIVVNSSEHRKKPVHYTISFI